MDIKYYYKIQKFLRRKPRSLAEADQQIEAVFPGSGMTFVRMRELGPYEWSGKIHCPILGREISCHDCDGYDVAATLLLWLKNREWVGCRGIARNAYQSDGKIISYRQKKRMEGWGH